PPCCQKSQARSLVEDGRSTKLKLGLQSKPLFTREWLREVINLDDQLVRQHELVILDEIQRVPELFAVLRGLIDRGRTRGRRAGHFLLLGSASLDLIRQSSETLAGRVAHCELASLDILEVDNSLRTFDCLWFRGGFPESFLANDDEQSFAWRFDFIRTYLERDIPQLGSRIPAETLRRFWMMLAHSQGALLNAARLGSGLGVSGQMVARYTDLLVDLLLERRLRPLHRNVGKRLVRSPKVYIRDSGIVHTLLGISQMEALFGHPVVGPSWEGFVLETLLGVLPDNVVPSFYRTAAGAEIDLVLEFPDGRLWTIEIKLGLVPKVQRGFYLAMGDLQPERSFVVYSGEERYPLAQNVEAISHLCNGDPDPRAVNVRAANSWRSGLEPMRNTTASIPPRFLVECPLVPLLSLLGLPDPQLLAPATLAGITEMYVPALLVKEASVEGAEKGRTENCF
ncbi:MAG: ATP-binding protein, partial [Proteobacteria bacterium]|nr:ATP-binding protein [Pseudomonadota bacterium]